MAEECAMKGKMHMKSSGMKKGGMKKGGTGNSRTRQVTDRYK